MPKGRVLSAAEREEIARMHAAGASAREIGKQLERSKTVVLNFLKAPAQYAQIKRSGRKRALSGDDERRLFAAITQRMALPGAGSSHQGAKRSAEQIRREFNVPLSTRRIQQLLSEWRREARRAQDQQSEPASAGHVDAGGAASDTSAPRDGVDSPVSSDDTTTQSRAQEVETERSAHRDANTQPEQEATETLSQEPHAVPSESRAVSSVATTCEFPASVSSENVAIEV